MTEPILVSSPTALVKEGGRAFSLAALLSAIAIAMGIGLRFSQLSKASLWFDEGYTAWVMSMSPAEILRTIHWDTAPPLYYLLLRGWVQIFGHSEVALRSMSALCSSLVLVFSYPLAKRILKEPWAVLAAVGLLSVSEMQISYAHEARFYSLISLLAEIDLLLVLSVIHTRRMWKVLLMIVAWSASLYTNNMMAVYLAALGVAWIILPGRRTIRGRLFDLSIVSFVAVIMFLPWLPTLLEQSARIKGHFWVSKPSWTFLVRSCAVLAGVNDRSAGWLNGKAELMAAAALIVVTLANLINSKTRRVMLGLGLFAWMPVFAIYVLSQFVQPIFMERAFIATTVFVPLVLAAPMVWLARFRIIGFLFVVGWGAASVASLHGNFHGEHPEQWREACHWADTTDARHRLIVFVANEGEMLYDYYQRDGVFELRSDQIGVPNGFFEKDPPRTLSRVTNEADLDSLKSRLAEGGFDELVLIQAHQTWADPKGFVIKTLSDALSLKERKLFGEIRIYRFSGRSRFVATVGGL